MGCGCVCKSNSYCFWVDRKAPCSQQLIDEILSIPSVVLPIAFLVARYLEPIAIIALRSLLRVS